MERIKKEQPLHSIAQFIVQHNLLDQRKIIEYQKDADLSKQPLLQYLIANKLFSAQQLALTLSEYFGMSYFDLDALDTSLIPWRLVNEKLICQFRMAPLFIRGDHLFLATDDPTYQSAIKEIQFHTGLYATLVIVESHKLSDLIEKINQRRLCQGPTNDADSTISLDQTETAIEKIDTQERFNDDAPIVKFVNKILFDAIQRKASDIHFEPYEESYRIRYRLDGILIEVATPAVDLASRITARIKIMSNLDISERRIPQDGRFKMKISETVAIDCRVNICPTVNGEKVVIRLLNQDTPKIAIEKLGFNSQQKELFLTAIAKPQGMILVTGPTGSGKTVSLYAALSLLNSCERNISTAEDPVEIKIAGINQVNITPKVGLTFANALRSFLRQDPDIIMVGEIRDLETAEIAIKAAHTGHLVLSTLHTNSAAETLMRLSNMGVPSFNIASSVNLLVAQRLVRRLCDSCKVMRNDVTTNTLNQMGFHEETADSISVYKASGCKQCINGYSGRTGLFEVMPVSTTIASLITSGASSMDIFKQAQAEGMLTLYQSGLEKIRAGITTIEELNRVTVN